MMIIQYLSIFSMIFCISLMANNQITENQLVIDIKNEKFDRLPNLTSHKAVVVVFVPVTHAPQVREALGRSGAGKIGNYSYCNYYSPGMARFMPNDNANPYIGSAGVIEEVPEERIQAICSYEDLENVIEEVKKVHPYEEPGIDIHPIYTIQKVKQDK